MAGVLLHRVRLDPKDRQSTTVLKYSAAWRTFTSASTPVIPPLSRRTARSRYLRVGSRIFFSFTILVEKQPDRQVRLFNFHTVPGYAGWGGAVSCFAYDLLPDGRMEVDIQGGGTYLPGTDNFSGPVKTQMQTPPLTIGRRYKFDGALHLHATSGSFEGFVDGKPWVKKSGMPTAWPGKTAGAEQYAEPWEGGYIAFPPDQQGSGGAYVLSAGQFALAPELVPFDVPTVVDYWHSIPAGDSTNSVSDLLGMLDPLAQPWPAGWLPVPEVPVGPHPALAHVDAAVASLKLTTVGYDRVAGYEPERYAKTNWAKGLDELEQARVLLKAGS